MGLLLTIALCNLFGVATLEAAEKITRDGWSFDRSQLNWYPGENPEAQKAKGSFMHVEGWTEFDFTITQSGWYELYQSGIPSGWSRDVSLDGAVVLPKSLSTSEDVVIVNEKELTKEANLWLGAGKHVLRFHRALFPSCLPNYWELRFAENRPEASIRVTNVQQNVQRAGATVPVTFSGGAGVALSYELLLRDVASKEMLPAGHVDFPATEKPQNQTAMVMFPRQGNFQLLARSGSTLLKPADLKADPFVVIDTRTAPAPAAQLKTKTIIDIDCIAQTLNGKPVEQGVNYFENRCQTNVIKTSFGSYRESICDPTKLAPKVGGDVPDKDPVKEAEHQETLRRNREKWGLEAFAYKFDLPDKEHLYRLQIEYPDDDRRTIGFILQDFPEKKGGWIQTGGVETGDHYPLTKSMLTHEAYFFCREPKGMVLAVVNQMPDWKAAAAHIRIDRVEEGLPAAPAGESRGRAMGFYFEEPGRWDSYFGGDPSLPTNFETMERWAKWNRYLGSNLLFPTVSVYNGIMWPVRSVSGWGTMESVDTPRMLALVAEKYGQKFVPEIHVSVGIMGIDTKTMSAELDEVIVRSCDGETKVNWSPRVYNALHPKVQEKYLALIGELADNLKDSPAFAGISLRLMLNWQWAGYNALPGLKYGYEDWTIAQFQKETGNVVPGNAGDPKRFRQRFDYLTTVKREAWLDWRCRKIFALHQRLRDRIRQARPEARLFLTYFGPADSDALATDMLGQMREIGMDPKMYEKEPGFVVIQGGMYGRRFSNPVMDASVIETGLYDPQAKQVGLWGDRGYSLYTSYFEYGKNVEFDRLGGKNVFINDCTIPSGSNERELYAIAMADSDTGFFINGGAGWMFGTPKIMQPFLREYRALPAFPFTAWDKARDPVAIWFGKDKKNLFFYAVNRLPVTVKVVIKTQGASEIRTAATGETIELNHGEIAFDLEPFMLRSFVTNANATLVDCSTQVPSEFVNKVIPIVVFAKQLRGDLAQRRIAAELGESDTTEAIARLDAAINAFANKEYWKASRIDSLPLVQIYSLTGRFPPGMWDRSIPHGLVNRTDAPKIDQTQTLGDVHARLSTCLAMDVDRAGKIWVASDSQIMRLSASGEYEHNLHLTVPIHPGTASLPLPRALEMAHFIVLDEHRVACHDWPSPLWIFNSDTGRALSDSVKDGFPMRHPSNPLVVDQKGFVFIAYNGPEKGVYKFKADGTPACDFPGTPATHQLTKSGANGGAIDEQGRLYLALLEGGVKVFSADGKEVESITTSPAAAITVTKSGSLVLIAQGRELQAFERGADGKFSAAWKTTLKADVTALRLLSDTRLAIGFKEQDAEGAVVREFVVSAKGVTAGKALVRGLREIENRILQNFTQLKARDGALYYGASKKIWRWSPGSEQATLVYDPHWPAHLAQFEAFAVAPNGDLFFASQWNGTRRGINLYRARKNAEGFAKLEYLNGGKPLYENPYFLVTDMEVDHDGNLLLRLFDAEENPHGHKVSLYRWSAENGASTRLLVLGNSSEQRGDIGLCQLPDGGLIVAGGSTRSLWRLDKNGAVVWKKYFQKNDIPGTFDSRQTIGVATDSKGRLWVTDMARNEVMCLAGDGTFLGSYGHFGTLDDKDGFALAQPAGIAVLKEAAGDEWIHIADIANQRIVRWKLRS